MCHQTSRVGFRPAAGDEPLALARLARLFSIGITALALGYSLWHAFQVLATGTAPPFGSTYSLLMPFAFLVALGVSARRTVQLHRQELAASGSAGPLRLPTPRDSVMQSLYALHAFTEATGAQLEAGSQEAATHTLGRIGETTRQSLREMPLLIHQLSPPELEPDGLVAALHSRLAAVEGRSGMRC